MNFYEDGKKLGTEVDTRFYLIGIHLNDEIFFKQSASTVFSSLHSYRLPPESFPIHGLYDQKGY